LTGEQIAMPGMNYDPTFETRNPFIDPSLAGSIYQQQQQINLRPSYEPISDPNILEPSFYNALLNQQFLPPSVIDGNGFLRQSDGSVSSYATQTSSRPPLSSWLSTNINTFNNQQQQPGPLIGFFSNLAQNNPFTNFLNNINPFQQPTQQQQQQTPILNFLSNLNPLNLFTNNNNNRPQLTLPSVAIQSDYLGTGSHSSPVVVMSPPHYPSLSNNIDTSVFSSNNDHFLSPGFNYPPLNSHVGNGGVNFGGSSPSIYTPHPSNSYLNQFSTTNRPFPNVNGNVQPYSYLYNNHQIPSLYSSVYRNPYQRYQPTSSISPIIALNPLNNSYYGNRRKTNKNGKKKNNKNKVDIEDTGSDWFHDFLDKRKEASLDVTSRRPTKVKSSDEDNDSDLEDYFR
jgi:hypothetical protein